MQLVQSRSATGVKAGTGECLLSFHKFSTLLPAIERVTYARAKELFASAGFDVTRVRSIHFNAAALFLPLMPMPHL